MIASGGTEDDAKAYLTKFFDNTVALPLLTAYAHARHKPRKLKRLLDKRESNMRVLRAEFAKANGAPHEPSETDAKLPMHR